MAEVDTSSYPKPAAPVSPLDVAGKLGNLQQQSQQIQQGAINIDQSKLKLYNDHFQIMNNELSTLANDPNITKEKVLGRLNSLADTMNMPPQVRQKMVDEFAPLTTKQDLLKHLDYTVLRGQSINERVNSLYGRPGAQGDGQTVTPSREYLRGGPVPSGAPIAQQAPPTAPTTRRVVDPETGQASFEPALLGSQPSQIPAGATPVPGGFPGQFNQPRIPIAPPLQPGSIDPKMVPTTSFTKLGEKVKNVEVMPPTSPGQNSGPIVPRGPATGAPTGAEEGIKSEVASGAAMANDLSLSANESKNVKALIGNMRNSLKDFTPGPLADYKLLLKSFANSNLPVPDSWKKEGGFLDPKSIASQEEFNKFSQMISQAQLKALGGTGATAHLDSVQHTSPGQFMSKLGIHGILATLDGTQDSIEAKNKEWRSWRSKGNGVETMPAFNESFNRNFDPRVFQLKYLSPEDRKKYVGSIDNAEDAQQFVRAYHHAKAKGWINYDIPAK